MPRRASAREAELKLTLRTKERLVRLSELLRSGHVEISWQGRDRYRRTLARINVGGGSSFGSGSP
jgi:endonuclease YncB( thermonuclease family)